MPKTEAVGGPAERVIDACHEPLERAWDELASRLAKVFLEVSAQGARRHRLAVESSGLDGDPPEEWEVRAERLLEYRRMVASELLEPMVQAYQRSGPAASIGRALSTALEECDAGCRELPLTVPSTWSDDALAPRPSDPLRRRAGKVFGRLLSVARKGGRARELPLRAVALRHLSEHLSDGQDQAAVAAMAGWAEWGRELETAWIEWGGAALPALARAELPEGEDAAEVWTAVRDAAHGLQGRLEALGEEEPHAAALASARSAIEASRGALEADLDVAGSFLLSEDGARPAAALSRLGRTMPAVTAWDEGIVARLQLYVSLLAIFSGASAVERRLVRRCRETSLAHVGDLIDVADALMERLDVLEGPPSGAVLRERLASLAADVPIVLKPTGTALPDSAEVGRSIGEVSDATVEALSAMIRQAPAALPLHPPGEHPPRGPRKADTRVLPLQQLARQSFDALRIERIRSSAAALPAVIDDIRKDLGGLPDVFSFAHDEALRELEGGEEGAEERAIDLVASAVKSMAESLRARVEDVNAVLAQAQRRLAREICDGSEALLDRVGAGRMQAQLLAARSRLADAIGWIGDRWGPLARRTRRWIEHLTNRLRRSVRRAARKGSELVGGAGPEQAASARAIQTLAEAQAVVSRLPLVYQRLFTLEPLTDATLLSGRASELASAMKRWRRWHGAEGVPLLVRGRQGCGVTSFLNVLGANIEADAGTLTRITLETRLEDEPSLARLLAGELDVPTCESLDDLAHGIFDADPASLPSAVVIDNLEHVYLRVPGGTDVIERLLTLMAETEPRMFWIAGVTRSAWQLVTVEEPTAVTQVDVFDLGPLDADAMRAAILLRHRRSGLDVRYEEPTAGRALLRRRLHRIRDREGYKKLLEQDFFERLHRTSGGYLGLALFQWLMAADFESGEGVFVRQPERPDFSVLESLDLNQNFTLKAFLEHRTLTLDEHDRIFRLPRHESYQVFESLRNRNLIEAVDPAAGEERRKSEIEDDLRYRLVPLITGAVVTHLQARNIVH